MRHCRLTVATLSFIMSAWVIGGTSPPIERGIAVTPEELKSHVSSGEGLTCEFKRCGDTPGNDTFETICSFANRQGGNIFLGVEDDGSVRGVNEKCALGIEQNLVKRLNDSNCFKPSPFVEIERVRFEGALVIRVWVPAGPAVYSWKGVIYDRVSDSDIKVRGDDQIALMYLRKQNLYSERRVYKYVEMEDLRPDLIDRLRKMATAKTAGHPWASLDDASLLRSAKLYAKDRNTGEEGLTLAAVLLVGSDDVISDICPAYKTDAIFRKESTDRYDDRVTVKTNLVESYDILLSFAKKHLPDRFVLEGTQRVSARDVIARELIANLLIHREFLNPFPAKLVIDEEGIKTENASRTFYEGRLALSDFNPVPKNPTIASVFSQIGLAEELGSGLRNLEKYSRLYSGKVPVLEDGDVFHAYVPVEYGAETRGADSARVLALSIVERDGYVTSASLAAAAGVTSRTAQRYIKKLVEDGTLAPSENMKHGYVDGKVALKG